MVYQTGGMIDVANTKHLIINGSSYGGSSAAANAGKGVLTLDGATAHLVAKRIVMGERKGESILNVLNGATLETGYVFHNKYQIYVESYGDEYRHVEGEITGDMEYVNFDGGVFKYLERDVVPRECSDDLFGNTFRSDDGNTRPKFVTVYSGGMTVDTAGADKMFSAPLLKPKSGGVMALSLPGGASHLDGYITAPFVDIKGVGQGATAVAIFDSATRRVTGVKVTSPGWGYAQGSTIATLSQCGQRPVDAVVLDVTVGDPAQTGGFTKRGAGNLTLTAANEILGPVSVEGGTLTIAKGASIDSTAPVSIGADAALSVEHGAVYAPEFVSGAGHVSGLSSVSVGADWNLKATDLVAGKHLTSSGELKLTAGGAVHVDDVAALGRKSRVIAEAAGGIVGALPTLGAEFDASEWEVSSDGRRLILRFMRGLVTSIR